MQCIISTPTKTETYDKIISVTLPTESGVIQIKPGHAEYITETVSGDVLCVTTTQKRIQIQVQNGICSVVNNIVTIVV